MAHTITVPRKDRLVFIIEIHLSQFNLKSVQSSRFEDRDKDAILQSFQLSD